MSIESPPSSPAPERLLSVACPACAATLAVDASLLGQAAECPRCDRGFRLPAAAPAEPPARPAPSRPSRRPASGDGDETASLKRTAAARAARRSRRNVFMLAVGGSVLLGIVMLLGRKRR